MNLNDINLLSMIQLIQSLLVVVFIGFSFGPFMLALMTYLNFIFPLFKLEASLQRILAIGLILVLIILAVLTIYGILSSKSKLRLSGTIYFSIGNVVGFSDSYVLSLGVILTWLFYEMWGIVNRYSRMVKEYQDYISDDIEQQKLHHLFLSEISAFGLLSWVTLSLSWVVLLITDNFYIELGQNGFGTLGITISIGWLLIVYLIKQNFEQNKTEYQKNNRQGGVEMDVISTRE